MSKLFSSLTDKQAAEPEIDTIEIKHANNKNMNVSATERLHCLYHEYQETLDFRPLLQDGTLRFLVTFDDAKNTAIHRWYSFKEGYSPKLLPWLQDQGFIPSEGGHRLLDPFCGVGTTLLSSQLQLGTSVFDEAVGLEYNPAIRGIASAKIRWRNYEINSLRQLRACLGAAPGRRPGSMLPVPTLTTFTTQRANGKSAFNTDVLQDLVYYRDFISSNCPVGLARDFFFLAWTAIIEACSYTKKDGRALRLLPAPATPPDVKQTLLNKCDEMITDLCKLADVRPSTRLHVMAGDARKLPFPDESFSSICYSPPYLNNIDYTEVYKLELWLRGDVKDQESFTAVRRGSMRSHPSVTFPPSDHCDRLPAQATVRQFRAALIEALPEDGFRRMRQTLFSNYIDDLLVSLSEQSRVALPGTHIVCVIGNSLHGGDEATAVAVCSDLLVAASAQAVGLDVVCIQEARRLPRRDHQNGWLRESIVVMRKPTRRGR